MQHATATQLLRDDHKRLTGLFRQLEAVDRRAHELKAGVASEIYMEIEIHGRLESQIFYPALLAELVAGQRGERPLPKTPPGSLLDPAIIDQSLGDHREIEEKVQELRDISVDQENYEDRLATLVELVQAHFEEEEQITIPAAERIMEGVGEGMGRLAELGAQIQALREELLRQPKYRLSRASVVQSPRGGEQMRRPA